MHTLARIGVGMGWLVIVMVTALALVGCASWGQQTPAQVSSGVSTPADIHARCRHLSLHGTVVAWKAAGCLDAEEIYRAMEELAQ